MMTSALATTAASLIPCIAAAVPCAAKAASMEPQEAQAQRPSAKVIDDLALPSYRLGYPMTELVESKAPMITLAEQVLGDINGAFARYRIEDRALEHELAQAAFHAAMGCGKWPDALQWLTRARKLEERDDLAAIGGAHFEAWIQTQIAGPRPLEDSRADYTRELKRLIEAHPWELVRHEVARRRSKMGMMGRGLLDMAMRSTLGPAAAQGGTVDAASAHRFLMLANAVQVLLPLKDEISGVYAASLEARRADVVDLWSKREVVLDEGAGHATVCIAVWDSGVDTSLFQGQLWKNEGESEDGLDNDGNGFIDDLHGIAYTPGLRLTTELLYPPSRDPQAWARALSYDDALADLIASIDSPASRKLQATMTAMDAAASETFVNELMHYAVHSHGTHVAGIAVAGNPYARLVVARSGLDHREPGPPKTLAWAHRFAASCYESTNYFVAAGVRVVNMSWGWGIAEIEQNLRATGFKGADRELRAHAREIHTVVESGIRGSISSAPQVLFICGAGNSGQNTAQDRLVPSCLRLPNLVTVGGVDSACQVTAFTSFGDHVRLYANGFRVESFVPGGKRKAQSGTSMSSPQVANLAAKILAVDPTLSPPQVIDWMERGAERTQFAGREVLVLNPRATISALNDRY